MNELNQILEKIATFNINANTNIDIQAIVQQYVMYSTLREIAVNLIWAIFAFTVVIVIYVLIKKGIKAMTNEMKIEAVEKFLSELNGWDNVKGIKDKLDEIVAYMPRNKKPKRE